ncbi:hypothetical protein BDZ97DRAFT_2069690 [Flammula alnicola]|nr:hypothetical protein BDZ97DRAFT_2069690 [Flammula alnicola]
MNRETIAYGFSLFGLFWYLAMWSIGILGCVSARRRYRSRPHVLSSSARDPNAPGVSILRPLKGLDTNLYENLESTFKQEYPNYEIIFSVADENDQALHVVKHWWLDILGSKRRNSHDLLWVIDSGVMVDPGTLARSVDIFTGLTPSQSHKRIGLVHHVPFALIDEAKVGSWLEAAFLNTNHAKMYNAINSVGIDSAPKRLIDPVRAQVSRRHEPGEYGLAAFGRFLAEDNMIAGALWHELGLRHDMSCDVARNVVGNMSFLDYVWRRVRWIRVRKRMVLAATLLEPFTESLMVGIIGILCLKKLFWTPSWLFLPLHFFFWLNVDLDVYTSIAGHGLRKDSMASFLLAWTGREILAFPIWLLAIFGDQISWRGRRYQILKNGEARLCST